MLGFCSQTLKWVLSQGLNQQGRPESIARSIGESEPPRDSCGVTSLPRGDCGNTNGAGSDHPLGSVRIIETVPIPDPMERRLRQGLRPGGRCLRRELAKPMHAFVAAGTIGQPTCCSPGVIFAKFVFHHSIQLSRTSERHGALIGRRQPGKENCHDRPFRFDPQSQ